jgi:triacylglycerol esterase/lipase EstA (alpha/beta hydrolase family)
MVDVADWSFIGVDGVLALDLPIEEAGEYLHQVMESLNGIDEICFVCHSLGGLVVRAEISKHPDARVKRMVLIGVPNTGAHLADIAAGNPLYKLITGKAGEQLVTDPEGFIASLPAPT